MSARWSLECARWQDWLPGVASASVDMVLTDPAWADLEKHRAVGTTTRLTQSAASSNEWFPCMPLEDEPRLWSELYRVLKPDRHAYIVCMDFAVSRRTAALLERAGPVDLLGEPRGGFNISNAIVWDKVVAGMGYHYRRRYELVLFAEKGDRQLVDRGPADVQKMPLVDVGPDDVVEYSRVRNGYPTEKPAELADLFVRESCPPGGVVLDVFTGSGWAGLAALRAGCRFLGCDVKRSAVQAASEMLAKAEKSSIPGVDTV